MKKLMFAAAVAAGLAAFGEGIESANTVGYQNKDARAKNVVLISTFYSIGTQGIDINSIVPVGDDVDGGGNTNIQILDNLNKTTASYIWLTEDEWGVEDGDGWYADDMETRLTGENAVTLPVGTGFLFQSPSAIQLQVSGEVKTNALSITARAKNVMLGNPLPVDLDLNDIALSGAVDGGGNTNIQILDALNKTSSTYVWLTEDEWGVEDGDGWYADDMETKIQDGDVTFAPGDGFLFQSPNAITVTFPAIGI